ncbi:MAG: hypothetical protein V9F04_13945 [Dermatophilaceae bacterium]
MAGAARRRRRGRTRDWGAAPGALLAPGTGDNMAAALGLAAQPGDVVVSLGTSGTAFAVSETSDRTTSAVPSPASPTRPGASCPLVCTLNAAQVLDVVRPSPRRRPRRRSTRLALVGVAAVPTGSSLLPYLGGRAHAEPARTPPGCSPA